ncbi:hypothetical protein ACETU7_26830 [Rhodococcus sp. 3Y1]
MSAIEYRLPQERRIVTEFPGPRSAALAERRKRSSAPASHPPSRSTSPTQTAESSSTSTATR